MTPEDKLRTTQESWEIHVERADMGFVASVYTDERVPVHIGHGDFVMGTRSSDVLAEAMGATKHEALLALALKIREICRGS